MPFWRWRGGRWEVANRDMKMRAVCPATVRFEWAIIGGGFTSKLLQEEGQSKQWVSMMHAECAILERERGEGGVRKWQIRT